MAADARTIDCVPSTELGFPVSEQFLRGNIGPHVFDGSSGLQRRIGRADESSGARLPT